MKAEVNMTILVIFVIIVGAMLSTILIPRIAQPSVSIHNDQQAFVIAKMISSSMNGLEITDGGVIEKYFELVWDIDIKCKKAGCSIAVTHEGTDSRDIGEVFSYVSTNSYSGKDIKTLRISKEIGGEILIEGEKSGE